MSLSQRCGSGFDVTTRLRGREAFDAQRVLTVDQGNSSVRFVVSFPGEMSHQVSIAWASNAPTIISHCSCLEPREARLCKHLWASLLEMDERGMAAEMATRAGLRLTASSLASNREAENAAKMATEIAGSFARLGVKRAKTTPSPPAQPASPPMADSPPAAPPPASKPKAARGTTAAVSERAGAGEPRGTPWRARLQHVMHGMQMERSRQAEARGPVDTTLLRQLWYVLDMEQSSSERRPVIAYFQRYRSSPDKPWGPYQSIALDRESIHRWTDPLDREILELLVGDDGDVVKSSIDSELASSRWFVTRRYGAAIPRLAYSLLLPKLCATQRLIAVASAKRPESFAHPIRLNWDGDRPYQIEFRMHDERTSKHWEVRSELVRDGERVAMRQLRSIDRGELAMISDRVVRLERNQSASWAAWLGSDPLRIPYEDGPAFLGEVLRFPEPPPIELPSALRWPEVESEPRALLKIVLDVPARARKAQLRISTIFEYGDKQLTPTSTDTAVVDGGRKRILKRNPKFEKAMLDALMTREGLDALVKVVPTDLPDVWCEPRQLEAATQAALRANWEVLAEGRLLRHATSSRLAVKSNMDWFELDGAIEFGEQKATFPQILAALRKGQTFVVLGDGSHGMLPAKWLAKFGLLADLGDVDSETLKFAPNQGLLLDALLEAAEKEQVSTDERFCEWRDKLRSFRGFTSTAAPTGFQGRLRPYQEAGLGWLQGLENLELGGCLADDMGLGKTIQVLALLESRRQLHLQRPELKAPSLVVAPKSLVFNWADEAQKFTPEMRVLKFTGVERELLRNRLHEYDLVLTTYGTLRRDVADLKDILFDYAVLDEAQAIKNATSQSAKSCRLIRARHRLAMTGTPIENHLGELWSLFEFINPGMLGMSAAFQRLTKAAKKDEPAREGAPADDARAALAQAVRPFILRRTKQQVLTELPERTEQTLFCEMEPPQRALYDQLKQHYRAELLATVEAQGIEKSKIHVLEALLRLRQAACDPRLIADEHAAAGSAKLDTLVDQLRELVSENHKALVFSQFTKLLGLVRERLDEEKIRYEYLDGQTANRAEPVKRFQEDPKIPLFLISLRAGGHGLNLTAADYVFILDPWWNPAVEAQAVDRAYRMGQTRHVFAYRLICRDTIEEKILELQGQKRSLADAILSEDNSVLRDLTADDLDRLLS
ncbi:MAG: DEAD/DEAH box helicase [Pirellulales bacterium]